MEVALQTCSCRLESVIPPKIGTSVYGMRIFTTTPGLSGYLVSASPMDLNCNKRDYPGRKPLFKAFSFPYIALHFRLKNLSGFVDCRNQRNRDADAAYIWVDTLNF